MPNDFYANPENLVSVLTHWLAIFSEGYPPIVPLIRSEEGILNIAETLESPCYAGFPELEKHLWLAGGK